MSHLEATIATLAYVVEQLRETVDKLVTPPPRPPIFAATREVCFDAREFVSAVGGTWMNDHGQLVSGTVIQFRNAPTAYVEHVRPSAVDSAIRNAYERAINDRLCSPSLFKIKQEL